MNKLAAFEMLFDLKFNAILALQCGFIVPILLILFIDNVPILASRFLQYGARNDLTTHQQKSWRLNSKPRNSENEAPSHTLHFLDLLATIRVSHRWFKHFYVLSVSCSLFWGYQLWSRGMAYQFLSQYIPDTRRSYMQVDKLILLWTLMFVQGSRRLYESTVYAKPTKSSMWIGHYVMGMGFYALYNMAIGVEGIQTLRTYDTRKDFESFQCGPWERLWLLVQVCCALICMYRQNILHHHLYTLPSSPNYKVPSKDEFSCTICPHYGYEISFYWLMASMATVLGRGIGEAPLLNVNVVLWLAYTFVYVNLRTTAVGTREWYRKRFGDSAVGPKALLAATY